MTSAYRSDGLINIYEVKLLFDGKKVSRPICKDNHLFLYVDVLHSVGGTIISSHLVASYFLLSVISNPGTGVEFKSFNRTYGSM